MNKLITREFYPGMGTAVAERTYARIKENGKYETWGEIADRVSLGNSLLCRSKSQQESEYLTLQRHIRKATIIMSGRHLQHGDENQPSRPMEVFTNCSTASSSFMLFLLLMSGSGVGRCYDDDVVLADWDNAPNVVCVISENHKDYNAKAHISVREAQHLYGNAPDVLWHKVEDTREGWAKALEVLENAAFEKIHSHKLFIVDFSDVRCSGSPIKGMQNRPASGPVPLMDAFTKTSKLKGSKLPKWKQAMYVDHFFADCVLVGGARRSARMSVKYWKDNSIFDFINIKRPIEYYDKSVEEIIKIRKEKTANKEEPPQGFLWSSNNSVLVDKEFWDLLKIAKFKKEYRSADAKFARKVFRAITEASYADGTGEPGIINIDQLSYSSKGVDEFVKGNHYLGSKRYVLNEDTEIYVSRLLKKASKKKYPYLVNPCSEIIIAMWGAFCVIGDLVPYFADTIEEIVDAAKAITRSLIRVNLMDSVYNKEVKRTNRIGIGMTGVHEFAWKFFGFGFRDLLDEKKSKKFWDALSLIKREIQKEAERYANELGVEVPHTDTCMKPSGTISKLFCLTEAWHLPALEYYLRWVQFSNSDPLIKQYEKNGYPIRELVRYKNTTIVGFPTAPLLTTLGLGNKLVTANNATPEEQYQWLILGEKYWLQGVDEGGNLLTKSTGNQISYTLKYDPEVVDYKEFARTLKYYQQKVRCCSVMPYTKENSYEYNPEEPISRKDYEKIEHNIKKHLHEDIDRVHVDCSTGACPIDFKKEEEVK